MISRRAALVRTAVGVPLALAAGRAHAAADRNQNWSKPHMLFLIWSFKSNAFFAPTVNGVKGRAVTIPDDTALNATLETPRAKHLLVIAFNIDKSKGAAAKTYRLAFVGQSFGDVGIALGKRLIAAHHLGKGDLVFTPVDAPQAVQAVQRHAGVTR